MDLEFAVDQDMDKALLLVANRLDRVTGYPDEAGEPTLDTAGSEDNPIAWFRVVLTEGNERSIHTYGKISEDLIQERLERVPGVGGVNIYGGSKQEMQVVVDPARMAQYRLTVSAVVDRLRAANASISGGDVEEGKRRYIVRTEGEFTTAEQVAAVVLRTGQDPESGRIARVTVGDNVEIRAFCHLEGAEIADGAVIGPFARLRPGARIGEQAHIGNFVEIKAAVVETGAKINHLSYVGDARVGAGANVGAGTITCNYDGFNKWHTDIGAGAFIGSNTALVAPVKVGDGAIIGAGSVITAEVKGDALAVTRAAQTSHDGWAIKYRTRKQAAKRKRTG